jgi:hypothetical protein
MVDEVMRKFELDSTLGLKTYVNKSTTFWMTVMMFQVKFFH